jgi:hypothetical protein
MLDIEGEIGQQEQRDQGRPIAPGDRDRRQPDLVDRRNDDAENDAVRRRLGQQVPDRDQGRNAGIFPRIAALPRLDHQCLDQDRDHEDREKDRAGLVGQFVKEVGKAEVELHCRLPVLIDHAPSI